MALQFPKKNGVAFTRQRLVWPGMDNQIEKKNTDAALMSASR
jgi:hypothetical protein